MNQTRVNGVKWFVFPCAFQLSGKAAVAAKNVYLQLVDGHQTLRSHGVVQLFTQPHPHRLPLSSRPQLGPLRSLRDVGLLDCFRRYEHTYTCVGAGA